MTCTIITLISLLCLLSCNGFVIVPTTNTISQALSNNNKHQTQQLLAKVAVELEPEPEGGIELVPRNSLGNCRVKKLEELSDVASDDGTTVYKFWMTAEAEGLLIKEIRDQILKDASRKANFPGFRKGQVPPFAQPQITQFSVQEAIIKTCQAVVDAYGLKSLSGSAGDVQVHEDVTAISKKYKIGDSVQFTATFNAILLPTNEPDVDPQQSAAASETVIDVTTSTTTVDDAVETEKETV